MHKGLSQGLGESPNFELPLAILMTLFSIAYFVSDDFTRFALHWALHRFEWLWQLHKVHHSAEVLSPMTVYRLHPLEMCLYTLRKLCTVALVAGLFSWLFAGKITGWMILGVDAAGFIFNFMAANLRHSHIWLSFGVFEKAFISPAQHQIHHSSLAQHRNKNFGSCLSLWDRCLGSLVYSNSVSVNPHQWQQLPFGLEQPVQARKAEIVANVEWADS